MLWCDHNEWREAKSIVRILKINCKKKKHNHKSNYSACSLCLSEKKMKGNSFNTSSIQECLNGYFGVCIFFSSLQFLGSPRSLLWLCVRARALHIVWSKWRPWQWLSVFSFSRSICRHRRCPPYVLCRFSSQYLNILSKRDRATFLSPFSMLLSFYIIFLSFVLLIHFLLFICFILFCLLFIIYFSSSSV